MDAGLLVKTLHILSAAVLFGTGIGIAFFMLRAWLTGDVAGIAETARAVVIADFAFTAPAVVIQPVTGFWLASYHGYPLAEGWIAASVGLYLLIGACWLPVVRLQMRACRIAEAARAEGTPLPPEFRRIMRLWFALGWPAFAGIVAIFWLMVAKPDL